MNTKFSVKILSLGLIVSLVRFAIGGALWYGAGLNPISFSYGLILTIASLILAFITMYFLVRPKTLSEGFSTALIWTIISLALDIILLGPILKTATVYYLLSEIQIWIRALIILLTPILVLKARSKNI